MWSIYDTFVLLTGIIVTAIAILPVAGVAAGTRFKSGAIGGGLILLALFLGSLRSFTYPSIVMGGPLIALLALGAVIADARKRTNPTQSALPPGDTANGDLTLAPIVEGPPYRPGSSRSDAEPPTSVTTASPTLEAAVDHHAEQLQPTDADAERNDAWLEVNTSTTTAERLSEIAAKYPEFGTQMLAHPNVYPALRDWIQQLPGDVPS